MSRLAVSTLDLVPYADALALQHELVNARKLSFRETGSSGDDTLILLEHPAVYTLGRNADQDHILASREFLDQVGIEVHRVERGGDVTYHGPGQLVGYPILDLRHFRMDIGWYVRSLEDVIIETLHTFNLDAHRAGLNEHGKRDSKLVGVWIDNPSDDPLECRVHPEAKIAQLGVRVESWMTYHGFALNVSPRMEHFQWIVPCGIPDKPVTSLSLALKRPVPVAEVIPPLLESFARVFDVELTTPSAQPPLLLAPIAGELSLPQH